MENQEVKKFIKSLGVPRLLWDYSLDDKDDKNSQAFKKYGEEIKEIIKSGTVFSMKLENDLYASRLAVYLLKCALKEDFIKVAYVTPMELASMYADSWQGSETYAEFLEKDLVVVDGLTQNNFRDGMKMSVFVGFVTSRLFSNKSCILVQSELVTYPARLVKLMNGSDKIVRISGV